MNSNRRIYVDGVEKSIDAQANVEMASLEKNMTWIALCIATAPMLGFLGTVWGMVSAFDAIAAAEGHQCQPSWSNPLASVSPSIPSA